MKEIISGAEKKKQRHQRSENGVDNKGGNVLGAKDKKAHERNEGSMTKVWVRGWKQDGG